ANEARLARSSFTSSHYHLITLSSLTGLVGELSRLLEGQGVRQPAHPLGTVNVGRTAVPAASAVPVVKVGVHALAPAAGVESAGGAVVAGVAAVVHVGVCVGVRDTVG